MEPARERLGQPVRLARDSGVWRPHRTGMNFLWGLRTPPFCTPQLAGTKPRLLQVCALLCRSLCFLSSLPGSFPTAPEGGQGCRGPVPGWLPVRAQPPPHPGSSEGLGEDRHHSHQAGPGAVVPE